MPAVARDVLGETWIAWVRDKSTEASVIHTRVVATANSLVATHDATGTRLEWTLSQPAPGSVWSIWRTDPGVAPREVARVRAGTNVHMRWRDPVGRGAVSYRLRREAIDARERWESAEVAVVKR
jgi:hypothetical protein